MNITNFTIFDIESRLRDTERTLNLGTGVIPAVIYDGKTTARLFDTISKILPFSLALIFLNSEIKCDLVDIQVQFMK